MTFQELSRKKWNKVISRGKEDVLIVISKVLDLTKKPPKKQMVVGIFVLTYITVLLSFSFSFSSSFVVPSSRA